MTDERPRYATNNATRTYARNSKQHALASQHTRIIYQSPNQESSLHHHPLLPRTRITKLIYYSISLTLSTHSPTHSGKLTLPPPIQQRSLHLIILLTELLGLPTRSRRAKVDLRVPLSIRSTGRGVGGLRCSRSGCAYGGGGVRGWGVGCVGHGCVCGGGGFGRGFGCWVDGVSRAWVGLADGTAQGLACAYRTFLRSFKCSLWLVCAKRWSWR